MRALFANFEQNAISLSFLLTSLGGVLLFVSGVFSSDLGVMLSGFLIALRGSLSELIRTFLFRRGCSEPVAAFPGMVLAAFMNWPGVFFAQTALKFFAFSLAAISLSLKFLQYLPEFLDRISTSRQTNFVSSTVKYMNVHYLDHINRYFGLTIIFSFSVFLIEALRTNDYWLLCSSVFLVSGGLILALKTYFELRTPP